MHLDASRPGLPALIAPPSAPSQPGNEDLHSANEDLQGFQAERVRPKSIYRLVFNDRPESSKQDLGLPQRSER